MRELRGDQGNGRVVHAVELEGAYPDTQVRLTFTYRGTERSIVWRIWHDEFSGTSEFHDPPEPPLGVVQAMSMDLLESTQGG